MRIRIYLTYQEIKDACRRKRDMETSYNASVNDVKYIDLIELERLIQANPEYIKLLKEFIEKLEESDRE